MLGIKEIFGATIQGEGTHTGSVCFFVRTSGCNMWNGSKKTKGVSRCCFCDTDFVSSLQLTPEQVHETVLHEVSVKCGSQVKVNVVITGGEPLLQDEDELIKLCELFKGSGFPVHLETNGTVFSQALYHFDYVTCSPKLPLDRCRIDWNAVTCLKLLYPFPYDSKTMSPERFSLLFIQYPHLAEQAYLQPVSLDVTPTLEKLYSLGIPWKLSAQVHKYIQAG